jgi:perosamine synthetase
MHHTRIKKKLALFGGDPVRAKPMPIYNTLDAAERKAVTRVLDSGILSQFLGSWGDDFFGGVEIQSLEKAWKDYFSVPYAVAMNSATSCLYAAVGAAGISPGDEVIVSPYTMSASATAALIYGGIPVFADIDPKSFCLTAETIAEKISERTKVIIVVDLFGHPVDIEPIMALAEENNLIVIEDSAQAPGAFCQGKYVGTQGHMGIFSLNYHKTIHCGEGGVIVTYDEQFAERLQLIRNHAEAVVEEKGVDNLINMVGFNFRMTEIEAAIAKEQLFKLKFLIEKRQEAANFLTQSLQNIPGLICPTLPEQCTHGYYLYPIKINTDASGQMRSRWVEALKAEGIPVRAGYLKPLYLQPLYQKKIAFGKEGFPFSLMHSSVHYTRGLCLVAEKIQDEELILGDFCHAGMQVCDLEDVVNAFEKIGAYYER